MPVYSSRVYAHRKMIRERDGKVLHTNLVSSGYKIWRVIHAYLFAEGVCAPTLLAVCKAATRTSGKKWQQLPPDARRLLLLADVTILIVQPYKTTGYDGHAYLRIMYNRYTSSTWYLVGREIPSTFEIHQQLLPARKIINTRTSIDTMMGMVASDWLFGPPSKNSSPKMGHRERDDHDQKG